MRVMKSCATPFTPPHMLHSLTVSRRGQGSPSRKFFATAAVALLLAAPVQADPGFTITLQFSGTTTTQQQQAFIDAKNYWESMISGYSTVGELNGITINADVSAIDGLHGILGQASPTNTTDQGGKTYTTNGAMQFDSADVAAMIANNSFGDVIRHEMGHVLGIGTLWTDNPVNFPASDGFPAVNAWVGNNLYADGTGQYFDRNNPGAITAALLAWRIEFGQTAANFVPVELGGGGGTAGGHWDETNNGAGPTGFVSRFKGADFMYEMMTGWANTPVYTSNVTVGGMVDLGYTIKGPSATNGVYNFDRTFLTTPEANANDFNLGRLGRRGLMVWGKLSGDNSVVVNADSDAVVAIMAANDYTLGTTVSSGTLIVGNTNALGTGGVTINGGVLDVGFFDIELPSLTLLGGGIDATDGSITVNAPSMDMRAGEVRATLMGGAALDKTTSGTLILSAANQYVGGTNINGGTLIANDAGALSSGAVNISNGSTLLVATQVSVLNTITLNDGVIGAVQDTTSPAPSITANAFVLKSGTVSAIIAGGTVTKSGAGTVTLSAANTHTQGTTVTEGTLVLANASALGSVGATNVAGGTLDVGTTAVVTTGNLVLDSGAIVGSTGSLTAASYTLRDGAVSAVLAGAGAVTKETGGTVTLSGVNTFTGGITVNAGTLVGAAADTLGAGAVALNAGGTLRLTHALAAGKAGVNLAGGTLTFGTLTEATLGAIAGTSDVTLTNDNAAGVALSIGGNNASTSYSGVLSGAGSLTKIGSGELTLANVNTYAGDTTVTAGTLTLGISNALGSGAVKVNGGTLNIGALAVTVNSLILDGGAIAGSTGTLDAGAYDLRSGTVGVELIGGTVTKSGDGDITLSLANTYTGGTVVTGGRLVVGAVGALSNGPVTVTGGTLDIGAFSMSGMGTLTVDGGTVTGTSGAYIASAFDVRAGVVAARLQGAAALTKTTTGTATLSASNGFLGGVAVNEGVLVITNSGALGSGSTAVASGATLRVGDGTTAFGSIWTGNAIALNAGGTLELGLTSTTSLNRALTGAGGVVQNASGTVTLANATYTGATVVNAGRLVIPVARLDLMPGALTANTGGTLAIAGDGTTRNFTRAVTGDGVLAFSGNGTTRLVNGSSLAFTGAIDIESGQKFSLGAISGESASVAARLVAIRSGARLSGSGNIAGSLHNAGTLSPGFSPGTITLGGDFTNTGTLTMEMDASTGAHDQIRYAGQAILGGTLNLVYLNGVVAKGDVVELLVDTDTSDGRPSLVGNFASKILPAGGGVAYNTGDGLNFLVGGTIYDIPGANLSPRLVAMAQAVASSTNASVANALDPITIPVASLAGAFHSASPLPLASAVALPIAETLRDTDELRRHLDGRRFERFDAADFGWAPYVSANGTTVTNKSGNDSPAFNYRTFGGHVGMDKAIGDAFTLGARISYDNGRADFHEGAGRLEQDHARVTVYGSKLFSKKFYVDGGAFGGASLYDVRQNTVLGANKGDASGWDAGLFVGTGFVAPLSSTLSLTPHAGLSYTHAKVGSIDETGSALALRTGAMNHDSVAARIGSGLNKTWTPGGLPLRVGLDASYVRELLDNETDINAAFSGDPGNTFKTSAVVMPRHRLEVGPEVDLQVAPGQSITASYKFEYAFGEATGHRIDLGYRARF